MWRYRLPALKPKNGRQLRRALQVSAEGHIAAHTAARLTLLATALDCTPAMDARRLPATGYLTDKLDCTLWRLRQQLRPSLRTSEIRLRRTVRTDFLLRVPAALGLVISVPEAQSRRSSDVVDPLCEVSIDVWQTLRPLLKQQAQAAQ